MIQATLLADVLREYILYKSLRPESAYRLGRALRSYEEFLDRPATLRDLADLPVSEWIATLEKLLAPKSVYGYRIDLLTLWRDAAAQGKANPPGRVRRVKKPKPNPQGWTDGEFGKLLQHVHTLTGNFPSGLRRSLYCEVLLRVCYDTGLRRRDVWNLRKSQVSADGLVSVVQHKTGWLIQRRIRPETLPMFLRLPGETPLACPYANPSSFYKWWRSVTKSAGVRHGVLQRIRKTGASHLAKTHRDSVSQYLGHQTAEMAMYYIDESIASPAPVLPPGYWWETG